MICRVCDSTRLELAIDLGTQPWANHFLAAEHVGKEPSYPLRVLFCTDCATTQLDYTVPKEVMFSDHTYLSGMTASLSRHFETIAREVDDRFFARRVNKAVLDIGSNDGTQLKHFQSLGWDVLGIESSVTTARLAVEAGVPTVNAFFNADLARSLGRTFDVVNASGVFFHLEELHSVTAGIRAALRPEGVFVVQFLYMKRIVENLAFDQIYHEHLLYYNLRTLERLLARHGLRIFDAYLSPIHGGSVMAFVTHADRSGVEPSDRLQKMLDQEDREAANELTTYQTFARAIEGVRDRNVAYLDAARASGKMVYGMGAPVKGNTLLNYFQVGPERIRCLVEKNPLRRGLFSPGMHIPIVLEADVEQSPPDIYYVLAWNFKTEILARYRALVDRGVEFFFPVNAKEG